MANKLVLTILLYSASDTGKIILLEPIGCYDSNAYQDLRSDEEKKLTQK